MKDYQLLKDHLIASRRLTDEMIARAEDYALTSGLGLDESIIFLQMLSFATLGQALAEMYRKPYEPLLGKGPADAARLRISLKAAEALCVFPLAYDAKSGILKLAVSDPEDESLVRNLRSALTASVVLEMTVASRPEILMAIDVYYKGRPYIPEPELHLPQGFTIVSRDDKDKQTLDIEEETKSGSRILLLEPDLERSRALMTLLRREGFPNVKWVASVKEAVKTLEEEPVDRVVANARAFRLQGRFAKKLSDHLSPSILSFYNIRSMLLTQEHAYAQMSASVVSLVSFAVRRALQDAEEALGEIIAVARYCKLLAMRMGLPAVCVDGAVLAAWLSAPGIGKVIYESMASPYALDELFDEGALKASARVELHILTLVKKYFALKKASPEIAGDMDKIRKSLAGPDDRPEDRALLEAFLNVIRDDEFLKDVGRAKRRIVVVDPDYSPDSALALRLGNDGYEVVGASDAKAASALIFNSGADVIISEIPLPGADGLRFCRALRENTASARLPFFFLTGEDNRNLATEGMEAGADDFFVKPPDLEMMSIKIRNILGLKSARGNKSGISGTLRDMSFTDIIQSLTTGDKDVEIKLRSGNRKGVIYIQQGEVIFAQAQSAQGQEAFYRMMTWQEGDFEIMASHTVPQRNIFESAMSLLMEGARIADDDKGLTEEDI